MDVDVGYICFYILGVLVSVSPVLSSHRRHYRHNSYYYYYESDGTAGMVAGCIIGGLIALCIIIAVIVVLVHTCNCCKTHGVRGHMIRPTQISTVTATTMYNSSQPNDWVYLPPSAPPYQQITSKPPQYTIADSNPPPSYEDVSGSSAPSNTAFQYPGRSTPAPPYSREDPKS